MAPRTLVKSGRKKKEKGVKWYLQGRDRGKKAVGNFRERAKRGYPEKGGGKVRLVTGPQLAVAFHRNKKMRTCSSIGVRGQGLSQVQVVRKGRS